jgi:hypothetical protein
LTWFYGSHGPGRYWRLSRETRQEPFTPRLPRAVYERPLVVAAILTAAGVTGSWVIIVSMATWPLWTIFPAMIASVLALTSTAVGLGMLVVLSLQPIIGSRDLNWHAEPLAVLGLPMPLHKKCESLGFWTCESMLASIEKRRFPWTALEYDERMQVERAISRWHSATIAEKESTS